ncbi:MAG: peptidylprolyl isomerase [Myxococcota bacterium]
MLDYLRNNAQSTVVYFMFAAIIIVFVFTFNTITPDQACGGGAPGREVEGLFTVGGENLDTNWLDIAASLTIDPPSPDNDDLQAQYRLQQYKSRRFGRFGSYGFIYQSAWSDFGTDPSIVSPIMVERAMTDLIETVLVSQEAEEVGIQISDTAMSKRLIGTFDYWYDEETGEFDPEKYDRMVRFQIGASPSRFEAFVRMDMQREAMITLLVGGLDITESELLFHQKATGNKVDLEFAAVDASTAAALVKADEASVTPWLAANQEKVASFYKENATRFDKAERAQVRGIQFRAANRARVTGEEDAAEKAKLQKERDDAKAKAEAAWLALAGANASLPAPLAAPPEDAAKKDAEAATASKTRHGVAIDLAAFEAAVTANSDHGPTKEAGGLFDEHRDRERLGRYPFGTEVVDPIFALEAGQMSGVIEVDTGFWILRLEEKLAAESKTLEQAQMEIATQLYKEEQGEALKKTLAAELLAKAKAASDKPLSDAVAAVNAARGAAEGEGLTTSQTGLFARMQAGAYGPAAKIGQVPTLGDVPDLAKAAFKAGPKSPVLGQVFEVDGGKRLVVARWAAEEAAAELDDAGRAGIREKLLRQKQRLVYRTWYESLLAKAIADGRVEADDSWNTYLDEARRNFVEAGGRLAPEKSLKPEGAQGS